MEKNAKIMLLQIITTMFFIGCNVNSSKELINKNNEELAINSLKNNELLKLLSKIESNECGQPKLKTKEVSETVCYNDEYLKCVLISKNSELDIKYKVFEILNFISFEEIYYTCYLDVIKMFNDERVFGDKIKLLKYDWKPEDEPTLDFVYAPVNYYVYWQLLIPEIKAVNNLPLEKSELFVPYEKFSIMGTEEFYIYMKKLWESDSIELNSAGH